MLLNDLLNLFPMIVEFHQLSKLLEMTFEFGLSKNLISFDYPAFGQKMRKNVWVTHFKISHT